MRSIVIKIYFVSICILFSLLSGCKKDDPVAPVNPPVQEDYWELKSNPDDIIRSIKICSNGYIFAETPGKILRSTDEGKTWGTIKYAYTEGPIAIGPNDEIYATGMNGVYYSYDYGQSWGYNSILFNYHGQEVGAFIYCVTTDKEGRVYLGTSTGVMRSDDKGHSWKNSEEGMDIPDIRSLLACSNGDIIAGANSINKAIYISKDKGETWIQNENLSSQGILAIAEDSLGGLYAGGFGAIYYSKDNGMNWDTIGTLKSRCQGIITDKNNYVYATITDGGMFISSDRGITWEGKSTGLKVVDSRCLVMDKKGYIYLGTDGYGIYKSKKPVF